MIDILRTPDSVEIQTEENNKCSDQVLVSFKRTSYGLQVYCQSLEERVRFIILRWKGNVSDEIEVMGDIWTGFPSYLQWNNDFTGKIFSWYFMASLGEEYQAYGVMTQARAMCFWEIRKTEIVLYLDVRCGSAGVKLGTRKLHAATIVSDKYEKISLYKALGLFCRKMCGYAIIPDVPIYGFTGYVKGQRKKTRDELCRDAAYLAKLAEGAQNRPYYWINKNDVPDWKMLAADIGAMKLNAGIRFRPLLESLREVPGEATLRNGSSLDPSHPRILKKIGTNVKAMCEAGFSLIIFDGSALDIFGKTEEEGYPFSTSGDWHFYDEAKTSAEIVMNFYHTIREAAGPYGAIIMGCNTIGHLGTGFMHIQTAETIEELLHCEDADLAVNSVTFRFPQHKNFFFVQAGILETNPMYWKKIRPVAEMIAYSGTPLFLSISNLEEITSDEEKDMMEILMEASRLHTAIESVDWEQNDCLNI